MKHVNDTYGKPFLDPSRQNQNGLVKLKRSRIGPFNGGYNIYNILWR